MKQYEFWKMVKIAWLRWEVNGTVSKDLSKIYDCLPYDLLIAKLEAYDVDIESFNLLVDILVLESKELPLVQLISNNQKLDVQFLKGQY